MNHTTPVYVPQQLNQHQMSAAYRHMQQMNNMTAVDEIRKLMDEMAFFKWLVEQPEFKRVIPMDELVVKYKLAKDN